MSEPAFAQTSLSRFTIAIWLAAAMILAALATFVVYVRAERQIDRANELRERSLSLADELRQSSDDLTRMVRTFVATGDPLHKQYYQEILDIRDGRKPRPLDYRNIYWDLAPADDRRTRPVGPAVPLLQLMRQAGFTDEEFAKLAEAKANSDTLTRTEVAAMALVESARPPTAARRAEAVAMLHDAAYLQAKARIMRPIGEFIGMVDRRTGEAVRTAEAHASRARAALIGFGVLLLSMLYLIRHHLIAILGAPVDEVFAAIARLGSGDFATDVRVARGRGDSVLGWLRKTQADLSRIDAERRQAEAAIRESERRFHQALDDLLEGCMLIDVDWTYRYVNEAAARHGRQQRDALIGRKMTEVYPGVEATEVFAAFRRVMEGRVPQRCEASYTFADGSTGWYEFSIVPTREGIFVLSLDITEQRLLAERLAATNVELERQVAQRTAELQAALDSVRQASEAKSRFLSNMSHELRTPMNAIIGFSQLLLMNAPPPDQEARIQQILRAGRHLLALIDDLLDLTRIETGQVSLSPEPVDPADLVDEALSIVRPLFAHKQLELANRLQRGRRVLADPVRLRQVVVNLLSNAAKYNRDRGRVTIDASLQEGQRLRLSVADTGRGIAPEHLPRLFRSFERLEASRRGVEGTGIGLALSQRLIEQMGGAIGVESRQGEGSVFWIELPLSPATPARQILKS